MRAGTSLQSVAVVAARLMKRVDTDGPISEFRPDLGPCWIWTGALSKGYGSFAARGYQGSRLVHRAIFEAHHGRIDSGLDLDHLCRVTACCNPAHLEPVTHAENLRRGEGLPAMIASRRGITTCKRGHEFTADNTYVNPGNGGRRCRQCHRDWARPYARARHARLKGAAA
jgi:hypothetical protein